MKISNQSFPHPVLGIRDDVLQGSFKPDLTWSVDRNYFYLNPVFNLSHVTIEELIDNKCASFVMHVECPNTFYKKVYRTRSIREEVKINSDLLRDKVEIKFFIVADENIKDYGIEGSHPDYSNYKFETDKGDILAYGGETYFQAVKNYESLRAVSSIMQIKRGDFKQGYARVKYINDKIILELSSHNYTIYNQSKNDKNFEAIFHLSLVLPILFKALSYIREKDDELQNFKWYQIIEKRLDDENLFVEDDEKHFQIIQQLFGNPVSRFFDAVQNINEVLYNHE